VLRSACQIGSSASARCPCRRVRQQGTAAVRVSVVSRIAVTPNGDAIEVVGWIAAGTKGQDELDCVPPWGWISAESRQRSGTWPDGGVGA